MWIPIAVTSLAVLGLTLLSSFAFIIWRRRNTKEREKSQEVQLLELGARTHCDFSTEDFQGEQVGGSQEFPSIQLDIVSVAKKHFSDANKLREGGFDPVYKGTLADGKEVAVKRLSRTSGQGLLEFKNEVMLIARLQHRNLVRLLGCCLEDNDKLLLYEYLPNRSLDVFLFDARVSMQLDWPRQFSIITGIARRIFRYMAPDYAMEGLFSVKSDVFSFGVLLLEIICGKKNNGFYFYERCESLLTFNINERRWVLTSPKEETPGVSTSPPSPLSIPPFLPPKIQQMQLIDPQLVHSSMEFEVIKCIHIGLLCVQKDPVDRPTMSSVIVMLASETITLPKPTELAFFVGRVAVDNIVCSVNEVTVSNVSPR
ncbi:hypothetical protein SLEP1_g29593 [Rubroshorea leprosula]|uniref:Protein kinase domain-containing protein n=1 Tax=Rubroshorea leprosula TaxID=152421 RepID=A0AAV5JXC7_9ROSI|nr:hypothetical protein SLEP1_g29593 [Rubroshorea leprosula]